MKTVTRLYVDENTKHNSLNWISIQTFKDFCEYIENNSVPDIISFGTGTYLYLVWLLENTCLNGYILQTNDQKEKEMMQNLINKDLEFQKCVI